MKKYYFFGVKAKYEGLSWWENFMGGHIDIGPITIYGENAMQWAVNWHMFKTVVCFRLPFRCFGKWWPLYFYISKNATPQKATFKIGNP